MNDGPSSIAASVLVSAAALLCDAAADFAAASLVALVLGRQREPLASAFPPEETGGEASGKSASRRRRGGPNGSGSHSSRLSALGQISETTALGADLIQRERAKGHSFSPLAALAAARCTTTTPSASSAAAASASSNGSHLVRLVCEGLGQVISCTERVERDRDRDRSRGSGASREASSDSAGGSASQPGHEGEESPYASDPGGAVAQAARALRRVAEAAGGEPDGSALGAIAVSGALASLAKVVGRPQGRWEAARDALFVLLQVSFAPRAPRGSSRARGADGSPPSRPS